MSLRAQGVCVWGPPDVQTERRALFSQAFVSVQILSTLQTLFPSLFVHFRRSEKFWRAEEKCYTVTYEVWWCFKWRIFLWKCTSVYPYKKRVPRYTKVLQKTKQKTWSYHDAFLYFSHRCLWNLNNQHLQSSTHVLANHILSVSIVSARVIIVNENLKKINVK